MDSEAIQIEVYSDPEVIQLLQEHNIVIGKGPASTSATTQPCDVGFCFKGMKKKDFAQNLENCFFDKHLSDKIKKIIEDHMKKKNTNIT
jgi:hypothetical protein